MYIFIDGSIPAQIQPPIQQRCTPCLVLITIHNLLRPCGEDVFFFFLLLYLSIQIALNNHLNTADPLRWAGEIEF